MLILVAYNFIKYEYGYLPAYVQEQKYCHLYDSISSD